MIESIGQQQNDNPFKLSFVQLELIDEVCIKFERALQNGDSPSIQKELDRLSGDKQSRQALLYELILLELELPVGSIQPPAQPDYEARFPNDQKIVERVFVVHNERTQKVTSQHDLGRELPAANICLASNFRLSRFHARGGLGVIYVARDTQHDRDVAVKFSRKRQPNTNDLRRLAREAAITGRLEHPGVVPVYATQDSPDQLPCFVMQLVDGQTLREAVKEFHGKEFETGNIENERSRFQSLEFRHLLRRFISVCQTVAYAHGKGVIHRDIKPANIMLGKYGKTVLLDWGLAKITNLEFGCDDGPEASMDSGTWKAVGSETMPGRPVGTPEFASPEQIFGQAESHNEQSDIYSLGATLYFLLTGKHPLELNRESIDETSYENIIPPCDRNHSVPRELNAICRTAMVVDQAGRYSSVELLVDDLERFQAGEPISVLDESIAIRAQRWARRHPKAVSAIAASFIVGLSCLAVGSLLLRNKSIELANSNTSLAQANDELRLSITDANQSKNHAMTLLRELTDRGILKALSRRSSLDDRDRKFLNEVLSKYKSYAELRANDAEGIAIQAEGNFRVGQVYDIFGRQDDAKQAWEEANRLFASIDLSKNADASLLAARCQNQYGLLLFSLGQLESGEAEILELNQRLEELDDKSAQNLELRSELAQTHTNLAAIYAGKGDTEKSIVENLQAIKYFDALIQDDPDDRRNQHFLAGVRNNLGQTFYLQGKLDGALDEYLKALEIEGDLLDRFPEVPEFRRYLANINNNIASIYLDKRQLTLARQHVSEAIKHNQKLHDTFSKAPEFAFNLGQNFFCLARILAVSSESDAGLEALESAVKFANEAVEKAPKIVQYKQSLLNINRNLAQTLTVAGRFEEATPVWRVTIELADHPATTERSVFAVCLAVSEPLAAIKECESLGLVENLKPMEKFTIACAYAMAAQKIDEPKKSDAEDLAIEWLIQAEAAGFFVDGKGIDQLKAHVSFRELVDHPVYLKIIAGDKL